MFWRNLASAVLKLPWRIDENCPKSAATDSGQEVFGYPGVGLLAVSLGPRLRRLVVRE